MSGQHRQDLHRLGRNFRASRLNTYWKIASGSSTNDFAGLRLAGVRRYVARDCEIGFERWRIG